MRVKLYRAPGMAEAMERVRSDLGAEAVILSTRRVAGGIELTAALEPEGEPPAAAADPDRRAALRFHAVPTELHAALSDGPMADALARTLPFAELPLGAGGAPLLFAGPPGAGKTLTVARLATRLVMAGAAPMIVTTDGYRAAAAEQLGAFARLLGLRLTVAHTPRTLARAVERRADGAPVLIDSTGCDAFSRRDRDAVAALAHAAGADVVAVLAAGADAGEAAERAAGLAEAGALYLVATKLDLTRRLGAVIAAAHAGGLRLTDAGVGPGAADGLVPLTPGFLAARLHPPFGARPC